MAIERAGGFPRVLPCVVTGSLPSLAIPLFVPGSISVNLHLSLLCIQGSQFVHSEWSTPDVQLKGLTENPYKHVAFQPPAPSAPSLPRPVPVRVRHRAAAGVSEIVPEM